MGAPMTAAEWRKTLDEQYEGDDGDDIEDEFSEDIDDEMDQVFEGQDLESWHPLRVKIIKEKMAPEDDLAQEMTHDLEMKFNKIEDEFPEDIDDEFSKAGGEVADSQDIFHVCKRTLESMQEKLKKSEDITKEDVTDLTSPAQLADEEIMVPVDMRGVNEEFIEKLLSRMLRPKGTAEAFVKAHECFKANQ